MEIGDVCDGPLRRAQGERRERWREPPSQSSPKWGKKGESLSPRIEYGAGSQSSPVEGPWREREGIGFPPPTARGQALRGNDDWGRGNDGGGGYTLTPAPGRTAGMGSRRHGNDDWGRGNDGGEDTPSPRPQGERQGWVPVATGMTIWGRGNDGCEHGTTIGGAGMTVVSTGRRRGRGYTLTPVPGRTAGMGSRRHGNDDWGRGNDGCEHGTTVGGVGMTIGGAGMMEGERRR